MAKHKARTRRSVLAVVSLATIAPLVLVLAPLRADAGLLPPVAPGKQVTAKDSHVTGICKMTVQAVNTSTGQVSIRLAAEAKPTNFLGYATAAYTQVFCTVYTASYQPVISNNPYRNGATVPNTATQAAVPFSSQYFVCATAFVKLNNGTQFLTSTVCA